MTFRKDHRVARNGLAKFLFAVLRSQHVRAITINVNALELEYRFRKRETSLGEIKSVDARTGWIWSRIQLRYEGGQAVASGLPTTDTQAFVRALETARVKWWRRKLSSQTEAIRAVYDKLMHLANPPAYLTHSAFTELSNEAGSASVEFSANWPSALSDEPEIQMLKAIQDFLKSSERAREKANAVFVVNELNRSKSLFDSIEKWPLTEEQRKSVVIDEDRNLVVAAAGSGKTSVIVAKAGWLLHRGYRCSSELLFLAFSRDAKKEMEERIATLLGDSLADDITVNTFHGLGLAIIGEVEGRRPSIAKAAEDHRALIHLLNEVVSELVTDQIISKSLLTWFQEQFAPYQSMHEFKSWGAYYDYIRRYEIRSLKGDKVKSFEECEIANFLYLNGIEYEYERVYELESASPDSGPYRPDFHLPDTGIWIEHFGINAEGKTAPFIPQTEYLESIEWKKSVHEQHGTTLIETFSYECSSGNLLRNLKEKLCKHGVSLSPISTSQAFSNLQAQGWIDPFIRLMATFLQHFKGSQLSFEQVMRRAADLEIRPRAEAFLAVFKPVFECYQNRLEQSGEIDFHDMIARAAEHAETGRYHSPFRYLLVDEFQDIAPDRARLLKVLLDHSPSSQMFAVGDDWQAIFRFAGSDISIMREFTKHFGISEQLSLETTFRCNNRIAATATDFILRNPEQITKTVRSRIQAEEPSIHIGLPGEGKLSLLTEAIDRIAEDARKYDGHSTVLMLGRYRHLHPQNLSSLARQYPGLCFTYKTIHGSKGLEADYVVVLGLCSGKHGFPSENTDDPLLNLVLSAPERYPNSEERRLMYVAITRAKRQAFLLTEGEPPSCFAEELADESYDTVTFGRDLKRDVSCPLCVEGRLLQRENKKDGSIFYGCSNFPYCKHREQPCPSCRKGLPERYQDKFKCRDCGQSAEVCPQCDSWLQVRMGKYGRFVGCTSYPNCDYTRNIRVKEPSSKRGDSRTANC